jgi:hypothetical protein
VKVRTTFEIRVTLEASGDVDAEGVALYSLDAVGKGGVTTVADTLMENDEIKKAAEEALRDAAADLREAKRAQARGGDE